MAGDRLGTIRQTVRDL